ncbi:hypothetical protein [Streptomyces sp. SM1]|uniref:hypothetical protein n=1 Tax=Streptomyces sp. SM1 TaxID=402229 RepID=UPI0011B04C00|nr:hypothetical protein [Streptomyces sp. SM1]
MAQRMNGTQRKAVWIKALGVLAAVAIAGIGAWAAMQQTGPGTQNTCHGGAVCGENNDNNRVGGGEPLEKK